MDIKDNSFKLYSEPKANLVKLNVELSYDNFEDLRIIAESYWYKANPRNQPLRYCMKYDVMDFLTELFEFKADEAYKMVSDNSRSFRETTTTANYSLYMHPADIEKVRKELSKYSVQFIGEYFLHEFCFLVSYYTWLIPKEMQHDYTRHMLGFFPIQPEEDDIENYLEKRESTYKKIKKIIADAKSPTVLKDYLIHWSYWKELKKRMNRYYTIAEELKTTNKESPNIMLLKKRAFSSFYCYLKYTVSPTIDTYYKKRSFVAKYGIKHNIPEIMSLHRDIEQRHLIPDLDTAIKQILEKKLYINSENELLKIVGGFFEFLNLSDYDLGFDYVKKFQEQQSRKRDKRGPVYSIEPDGTKKILWTKEEHDKQMAATKKLFNIKSSVEDLKRHSKRQESKHR